MKKHITNILENDVLWHTEKESITELDESSTNHISDSIKEGYSRGELHVSYGNRKTASGWWEIINWRDIACELYNANTPTKALAARKGFEENWQF